MRSKPQKESFLRWGRDKAGVWHLSPCMVITSYDLIDHCCTDFDTYIKIPDWLAEPPEGATICPVCRSVITRMVVEGM